MDTTYLKPFNLGGTQRAYQVGNSPKSVLVQRDAETFDWKVVDRLESSLSSSELQNSYGVWTDQKSGGFLGMFKSCDGVAQDSEVSVKDFQPKQRAVRDQHIGGSHYEIKEERSTTKLVVPQDTPLAPRIETDWIVTSSQYYDKHSGGGCG